MFRWQCTGKASHNRRQERCKQTILTKPITAKGWSPAELTVEGGHKQTREKIETGTMLRAISNSSIRFILNSVSRWFSRQSQAVSAEAVPGETASAQALRQTSQRRHRPTSHPMCDQSLQQNTHMDTHWYTHKENSLPVVCSDSPTFRTNYSLNLRKKKQGKTKSANISKSWQTQRPLKEKKSKVCQNNNYRENVFLKRLVQNMLQMSQTPPQIWGPLLMSQIPPKIWGPLAYFNFTWTPNSTNHLCTWSKTDRWPIRWHCRLKVSQLLPHSGARRIKCRLMQYKSLRNKFKLSHVPIKTSCLGK